MVSMQLFRFSSPAVLSALVLLFNFTVFTYAIPLNLGPRELTCAENYVSCDTYCCPPSHTCAANAGCAPVTATLESSTPTSTSTAAETVLPTNSASTSPKKKDEAFFNNKMIIAVATGGGIALVLLILATWACHRKRKQGRALLAAYEAPDRQPYEEISLKNKRSASTFASAAPPPEPVLPGSSSKPGTPTSSTFSTPQHSSTPPPDYKNGAAVSAIEKELGPRYPPQAYQGQDSPRTPTGSQRGPFPAEILGSPRSSSLPPYSPARSASGNLGTPRAVSPAPSSSVQQGGMLAPTQTTSPLPAQTAFSPTQTSFPPQNTLSPVQNVQTGFTFTQQGGTTPVTSPPASPRTSNLQMFMPVEENHQHPTNQELFLPVDSGRDYQQEQEMFSPVDEPSLRRQQPQDYGYPMAY